MRLFAGSVGVANSMQYLVLLPGLALVHRRELFTQSRTHVTCNDEARAERYPKRYLNDTKKNPKAPGKPTGHTKGQTDGGCW